VNWQKYSDLPDEDILQLFREDHNNEWIGLLFSRYAHLLLGVCIKYLKNTEDAKDSIQQIFLKTLDDLRHHQVTHFKAWIYQVSRNYCLMQLRSGKRIRVQSVDEWPDLKEDQGEENLWKQHQETMLADLDNALCRLPEGQKTCVVRFYLDKKSYQDIASETGFSMMQVKSHIQNGKRNLRILLDRRLPPESGRR